MFIHRFPGLPIIDRPDAPASGDLSASHHPIAICIFLLLLYPCRYGLPVQSLKTPRIDTIINNQAIAKNSSLKLRVIDNSECFLRSKYTPLVDGLYIFVAQIQSEPEPGESWCLKALVLNQLIRRVHDPYAWWCKRMSSVRVRYPSYHGYERICTS